MVDPTEIPPLRLATGVLVEIARLARRYRDALKRSNALDFDDLLLEAVRLFDESPDDPRRSYQERWRYLHVDEYQDTNRPQYLWVKALAAGHRNLAVVGDDDQSIYGWRGADIRNILDFERDWPDATVVKLEQNYRSTQLILDAAHAVVSKNEARTDKKLWTKNDRGRLIERFEAYNEEEEAEWIVRRVEELTGTRGSVLTRRADDGGGTSSSATSRSSTGPTPSPGRSRRRASATASATRSSAGPGSTPGARSRTRWPTSGSSAPTPTSVSFERVINVPARSIGDKTIEVVRAVASREDVPYWLALERAAEGGVAPSWRPAPGAAIARLRGARPPPPDAGRGPAAARAPRRRPRAVGLPGDARRRDRGGRGALGEPPRAARGHDPLRRPVARRRARPPARGDRARRRPGQRTSPTPTSCR